MIKLTERDTVGFIHPAIDIHTLGISSASELLQACGISTVIADHEVCQAIENPQPAQDALVQRWVRNHGLTALGFSYRLDPEDGLRFFRQFVDLVNRCSLRAPQGPVRALYFAGLPETCALVSQEFPWVAAVFIGDETPGETCDKLGITSRLPPTLTEGLGYDEARWNFATELIDREEYRNQRPVRRIYQNFGSTTDTLVDRLIDGRRSGHPPLMRAHVGAYLPDRQAAVELNLRWARDLAQAGFLDVLSVGSSQLTQSDFFHDWGSKPNGGGVPLQTPAEFDELWAAARPMLVRAYSGTRDIVKVARVLENHLHIAWHALSFWWFCQIDGRGPHTVRHNLREHVDTLRYIASTRKPFEPNIPHHFAFRGADDVAYIVSGFLAARVAQKAGIQDFVLQVMLNTPKATWGIQDLAKARALLELVRGLSGPGFRVHLQPRAGLDYFSPIKRKAKVQLAAVTALMDDIEPEDATSPPIIHVVSYSEASHLADPGVVNESIQITRQALEEWRALRSRGDVPSMARSAEVDQRTRALLEDARQMIAKIDSLIPEPDSPEGLYQIMAAGFFPVPYLWECREEFSRATQWKTKLHNGGVVVVDAHGAPLSMEARLAQIEAQYREGRHG